MTGRIHVLKNLFRMAARPTAAITPEARHDLMGATAHASPLARVRQMYKAAKTTLTDAWELANPYFMSSAEQSKARWLLAGTLGTIASQIGLMFWLNQSKGGFINGFVDMKLDSVVNASAQWGAACVLWAASEVYRHNIIALLQLNFNKWLTKDLQKDWLGSQAFYRMQKDSDPLAQNPEQRMLDDAGEFTWKVWVISTSWLDATLRTGLFSSMLWQLGGSLDFQAAGHNVSIPFYMLGLALLYSGVATTITHMTGKSLPGIHNDQSVYDAGYRNALIRIRENAETIALYKGEAIENDILDYKLDLRFGNTLKLIKKNMQMDWVSHNFGTFTDFLPFIALVPQRFTKGITLGAATQVHDAFVQFVGSLSWFMSIYQDAASFQAVTHRLMIHKRAVAAASDLTHKDIIVSKGDSPADAPFTLDISDLTLLRPDTGETLIKPFSMTLRAGDRLVLTGAIGSGKSSLFRAIAGLWDEGRGSVTLASSAKVLFLPQKPYMPLLTLRGIVCYPEKESSYTDAQIIEAMEAAGLSRYLPYLNEETRNGKPWETLSGGEKQSLAVAGALLKKPDIILMDEPTSAMDTAMENRQYSKLNEILPQATIISIGHRESVIKFHNKIADIKEQRLSIKALEIN